jgi:hypothetical protein
LSTQATFSGRSALNLNTVLKKQSQFAPARIGAKSFVKGNYENISRRGLRENKAEQSQFIFFTAENAESAEQKDMCVSD